MTKTLAIPRLLEPLSLAPQTPFSRVEGAFAAAPTLVFEQTWRSQLEREFAPANVRVGWGEMLLWREELARSLRALHAPTKDGDGASPDLIHPLSERENEVLLLLATGLGNREIGELLFVSENTIKTHVVHIIGKLGVSDRVQAAVWAARGGLLELE